jgi:hypothetical protein
MEGINSRRIGYWRLAAIAGGVVLSVIVLAAKADDSASKPADTVGNVEFDCPDAPKTTMQVDLSQGLFTDMFGIGNAAISGVVEGLAEAAGAKDATDETKATAEQVEAARQMVELCGQLIKGVRVRVYEDSEKSSAAETLTAYYEKKLKAEHWETIARVDDGDEMVVVSAIRAGGAFKGLFVIANDGDQLVLTNVVCDVSPENVKKITSAATRSGLKADLTGWIHPGLWKVEAVANKD